MVNGQYDGKDFFQAGGERNVMVMTLRWQFFQACGELWWCFTSKLVVLPNNYSPDYAPFTVDKQGFLEKVPVQIRVSVTALNDLFNFLFFSDWPDQDPGNQWSRSNIWQPVQPLHDLVIYYSIGLISLKLQLQGMIYHWAKHFSM